MADLRLWLQHTFDSPEKTGELLQPELDSGLISFHDFQLAKEGLPPQHTLVRWFTAGACVSAGLFAYGRFIRVPRARPQFYNMTAPIPAFVGGSIGLYKEVQAKRRLAIDLDNPDAFAKAILNVRDRLQGPPGRLRFGPPRTPSEGADSNQPPPESQMDVVQSDGVSHVSNTDHSHEENSEQNNYQNRWAAIRRANTQQSGRMTSWDILRQRQQNVERRRAADSVDKPPQSTEVDKDQERAFEQAKFDAMLEAERKLSADGK